MNKLYYGLAFIGVVFFSIACNDSGNTTKLESHPAVTDPVLIEIYDLEKKTQNDTVLDRNLGLRLLRAYQTYYNQNGTDSLSLHYLFEAARVADALGKYDKAIDMLISYHDLIRNEDKRAESAFLVAFIYDAHLKNSEKAIEYYNKVIEHYPKSIWADQAKAALHLVTMSDDDLIQFLDQKNQQSTATHP